MHFNKVQLKYVFKNTIAFQHIVRMSVEQIICKTCVLKIEHRPRELEMSGRQYGHPFTPCQKVRPLLDLCQHNIYLLLISHLTADKSSNCTEFTSLTMLLSNLTEGPDRLHLKTARKRNSDVPTGHLSLVENGMHFLKFLLLLIIFGKIYL